MGDEKSIVKAEDSKLSKAEPEILSMSNDPEDVTVIAATPKEMDASQKTLITWAEKKLTAQQADVAEAEVNWKLAKKRKWKAAPFESIVHKAKKRFIFYEKVLAALKAGYCIVPNMDIQVFAVRTTRKKPKENLASRSGRTGEYIPEPWVKNQDSNRPPVGEGKYVDVEAFIKEDKSTHKNEKGEDRTTITQWASNFDEEIDFPFKMAKPQILNATGEALALKIFDDVGKLPTSRGADPMIIGRVTLKEGYRTKSICFVISWFVDTSEL